jgi:hypothetical protein
MADNKLLQQMLESLVNDDQAKAEELFHDYVVQQSREIYESMIDSEIAEEEEKDEDEEVEEASDDEEKEEDKVEENFEDMAYEGDDEMDLDSEDPTDDLAGELGGEDDMEGEDKGEEDLFQDLEAIVDELQAKFDELKGHEEGEDEMGDMGDDEGENPFAKQEGIDDLETVREYVEKVNGGFGAKIGGDNGVNTKSIVAGKNDMGGTTANIAKGGEAKGEGTKGGLLAPTTKPQDGGNINVPGGKAGGAFSKKEPGHGAEKAGAKESADNKQSLFRGRR